MVIYEKIKSPKRFYVKDRWLSEFHLYSIKLDHTVFTYHHLPHFFGCNSETAVEVLEKIENDPLGNIDIANASLAFFKHTVDLHLKINNENRIQEILKNCWPISQKLLALSEFHLQLKTSASILNDQRIKLKSTADELEEWCLFIEKNQDLQRKIIRSNCQLVFDLNQDITSADKLRKILKQLTSAHWSNNFLYLEEPATPEIYSCLSASELDKIALDETLQNLNQIEDSILTNVGFYILKPSLLSKETMQYLLSKNKKISLSSSYEHPSLKIGFSSFLSQELNNEIHGLSTFELFTS